MDVNEKRKARGLGRGLSALMADVEPDQQSTGPERRRPDFSVPIEQLKPNPDQPRRTFTQSQLEDLAASIKEKGIIQPLIVRAIDGETAYEIVAGERRWRAAQMAQLHEIPIIVREFDDTEVLEIAIIENIQRADLNPLEEAAGYRQLMERFGHTQEKLAEALGKSRSHIANLLRLMQLPEEVQELVRDGAISMGHARALITSPTPVEHARKVAQAGLSVRDTEKLARRVDAPTKARAPRKSSGPAKDADTVALEGDLAAALGMKVAINHGSDGDSGTISIRYESLDQLDELCRLLNGGR